MKVLEGKTALVTGAARGIGLAAAQLLAEQGARVLLVDLDGPALAAATESVSGEVATFAGDLTAAGACDGAVEAAIDTFGALDIVVNNAGYTLDGPLHRMSDEDFDAMLEIHAAVPFRILRAAAPHLRDAAKRDLADGVENFRKVVNVTSVSGTMGNAGQANYAAGKAAVVGITKSLAKEWGPLRINVNAVAFGFIDTRLTGARGDDNVIETGGREVQLGIGDHVRDLVTMLTPLGRTGTPQEAAGGIFFLCSPWSNYVHGQVLNVTGGSFLGMTS